ncbi:MAG: ATP-dependent RNA helicase [Clostridia bacterium]|nr:ATP-dependent RNA helicase [Clostridia bacterium]
MNMQTSACKVLPIAAKKDEIIEAVKNHTYTIISAEPASGKSTLVPQYLSEIYDKVIVTNPRVMPCITLATYVAEQMGEEVGGYVGYRTGSRKCSEPNTVIDYVTDEYQLVKSIYNSEQNSKTVLVIDEVHEWTEATECLVAWCEYINRHGNMKVVIMSATMETTELEEYLGIDKTMTLEIPGKLYSVAIDQRPANSLLYTIREKIAYNRDTLVFLPTKKQIYSLMEALERENAVVLPLHGDLSWSEQSKCYQHYSKPRVILSTDIAQTSVSIPGINSLVDTGTAIRVIAKDGVVEYRLIDISQADITQRMNRAGRMEDGDYTLCSDTRIEWRQPYSVPAIQRSLLDQMALKLATIGVDIETLRFFHQPKAEDIKAAKQKLKNAGALDENGNVTEMGEKIARMPISTEKARMILEAEKHGVVKEVITIAAITEVGGLLHRGSKADPKYKASYSQFTDETTSDLLAELDVWNYITSLNFIDFRGLGINKKNFYRAKEQIEKIIYAIQDIVEISSSNNREAILMACLSVQTTNIHIYNYSDWYSGEDGEDRKIDMRSCLHNGYMARNHFIVGKTIRIPYKDRYGDEANLNLLTFATKVDSSLLIKLVPDRITFKEKLSYSYREDAVIVEQTGYFCGIQISYDSHVDYNHPEHARLKAEYESMNSWRKAYSYETPKQSNVIIDGKVFDVYNNSLNGPIVDLDSETIFTSDQNEVFLDNGKQVWITNTYALGRKCRTISELKKAVEIKIRGRLIQEVKDTHKGQKVPSVRELLLKQGRLGEVQLYDTFGSHKHSFGSVYICLYLDRQTVNFRVVEDEETANSNTLTAIQHLFMEEINSLYGESKFSHLLGSKKKILTPREVKHKEDFDSFVKECMPDLSVENISERLELLAEFYQELMEADY